MVEDFVHTATYDPASGIRDSEAIARTTLRLLESAR